MSRSQQRRAAIRDLIASDEIASQAELRYRLKKRGFTASQPVLSRDLGHLRVAKIAGVYQLDETAHVTPLAQLKSLLRSADRAQHFAIVRCEPGAASAVARALEAEELDGIVGTVAGDDTVLVAASTAVAGKRVVQRVAALLA